MKKVFIYLVFGIGLILGFLLSGCSTMNAVGGLCKGIGEDIQRTAASYDNAYYGETHARR